MSFTNAAMSFVDEYQLRQLLSSLVEVWPDDSNHPLVDEARTYLQKHPGFPTVGKQVHKESAIAEQDEDYTSMWFSL
ncbi:MAG: hypothetical protein HC828_19445 [Blastochloris sp.]|nr:hypothetical protein [Blastochloris sp.]